MKVFSSTYDLLLFLIEERGFKRVTFSGDYMENKPLYFDEPTESEVEKMFPDKNNWELFYKRLEDELHDRVTNIEFTDFDFSENFSYDIGFEFCIVKDQNSGDKYIEAKLTHESFEDDDNDTEPYIDLEEYFCTHNLNDDIKIPEYNTYSKELNFAGLKDGMEYTI